MQPSQTYAKYKHMLEKEMQAMPSGQCIKVYNSLSNNPLSWQMKTIPFSFTKFKQHYIYILIPKYKYY